MITVHGLKNCDTCRAALKWLKAEGVAHAFHDVREDGVEPDQVGRWIAAAGLDRVLNRRSTTWRGLTADEKTMADKDARSAALLMAALPALIKRPVFEVSSNGGDEILVGFGAAEKKALSGR